MSVKRGETVQASVTRRTIALRVDGEAIRCARGRRGGQSRRYPMGPHRLESERRKAASTPTAIDNSAGVSMSDHARSTSKILLGQGDRHRRASRRRSENRLWRRMIDYVAALEAGKRCTTCRARRWPVAGARGLGETLDPAGAADPRAGKIRAGLDRALEFLPDDAGDCAERGGSTWADQAGELSVLRCLAPRCSLDHEPLQGAICPTCRNWPRNCGSIFRRPCATASKRRSPRIH